MNGLLGTATAIAMLLITGNMIRGSLAFLVCVGTLAAFRLINKNRCWYCASTTNTGEGET